MVWGEVTSDPKTHILSQIFFCFFSEFVYWEILGSQCDFSAKLKIFTCGLMCTQTINPWEDHTQNLFLKLKPRWTRSAVEENSNMYITTLSKLHLLMKIMWYDGKHRNNCLMDLEDLQGIYVLFSSKTTSQPIKSVRLSNISPLQIYSYLHSCIWGSFLRYRFFFI